MPVIEKYEQQHGVIKIDGLGSNDLYVRQDLRRNRPLRETHALGAFSDDEAGFGHGPAHHDFSIAGMTTGYWPVAGFGVAARIG